MGNPFQFSKQRIKQSLVYNYYLQARRYRQYWQWRRNGQPVPSPHLIKQWIIKKYANRFQLNTLVETGTYMGEMVFVMRNVFQHIYSIELDETYALRAQRKFATKPHITILKGDSATILPKILEKIDSPCLFWLDAHYSAGNTARGDIDTPIIQELEAILHHPVKTHVILIDDAREFVGKGDYPKIETLKRMFEQRRPYWNFDVVDDIIRIHDTENKSW